MHSTVDRPTRLSESIRLPADLFGICTLLVDEPKSTCFILCFLLSMYNIGTTCNIISRSNRFLSIYIAAHTLPLTLCVHNVRPRTLCANKAKSFVVSDSRPIQQLVINKYSNHWFNLKSFNSV